MPDYKEKLYKLYDEYEPLDDGNSRKECLKNEVLDVVERIDNPDDEEYHIAGLVVYFSDQKSKADLDRAHSYFRKAARLNPEYSIARLYSAHCYHDKGEVEVALEKYLKVDREQIKNDFALCRYVKLIEQIGFCFHKVGRVAEARNYFEEVLWYHQNTDFDELFDALEIFQCLEGDDPIINQIEAIENEYFLK